MNTSVVQPWKMLKRIVLLDHPRLRIVEDKVELPNGETSLYIRQAPIKEDSVIVLATNKKGQLLLQREYSYPPNEILLQLPGGSMHSNEEIIVAANRELSEESGLIAHTCKVLGFYYTNNRFSNQKQHVVLCSNLSRSKKAEDPEEFIENIWMSREMIEQKIETNSLTNINLLAALNMWLHQ